MSWVSSSVHAAFPQGFQASRFMAGSPDVIKTLQRRSRCFPAGLLDQPFYGWVTAGNLNV